MVGRHWLAVFVVAVSLACGGAAAVGSGSDAGPEAKLDDGPFADSPLAAESAPTDALSMDEAAPSDATVFACGATFCRETEVCVHPSCGCMAIVHPVTDSGSCADGTAFADPLDGCVSTAPCPPPYCWSSNGYSLRCAGGDGSLYGIFDSVPDGSNLACYSPCT